MNLLTHLKLLRGLVLAVGLILVGTNAVHAQIFVTVNPASGNDSVAEYGLDGSLINSNLVSLPNNDLAGIAVSSSDLFVANQATGVIGEYTTSGQAVNASLLTGLAGPSGIAISGSNLFETNFVGSSSGNSIGEYTTSGAVVNASLVKNLSEPNAIVVSGSDLFVENYNAGTVGEYTTSGATVNSSLITGLGNEVGFMAVSGSDLFIANASKGTIEEFTTSGTLVNSSLISGLNLPIGIAISGSDLFVANGGSGVIGEYTLSGGTVNADLITGVNRPLDIAVEAVPEPSTWMLLGVAVAFFVWLRVGRGVHRRSL